MKAHDVHTPLIPEIQIVFTRLKDITANQICYLNIEALLE